MLDRSFDYFHIVQPFMKDMQYIMQSGKFSRSNNLSPGYNLTDVK